MRLLVNRVSSISTVVVLSIVVIILKVIFDFYQGLFFTIIFDLVLIIFFISLSSFFLEKIRINKLSPINLAINAVVISAIIFFLSELSFAVFENVFASVSKLIKERNIFVLIISSFYSIIILISLSYIFSAYTYLFFLKQSKNLRLYFNSMLVFLALASLSNIISEESQFRFIRLTFDSICVILFFVNSVRISWIAFLTKKHKLYLLLISIGLLILSGLNISNFESSEMISQIVFIFSPSLVHFAFLLFVYSAIYFGMLFFSTLFHLPTTDAFERKAKEVSSLQDFSKLLTQIFDFSELADNVTEITMSVCKADFSWLSISNTNQTKDKPVSLKNISLDEAIRIESLIQEKFIQEKIGLGEIRLLKIKLKEDEKYLSSMYPIVAFSEMKIHDRVIGHLFAGRKTNIEFDNDDLNAVKSFAEYSAIAIENSRLLKESIEKERLEKELDVAREVQLKILPRYTPKFENLDISSVFIPAFEVGGDYFDFFELNRNKLGIVIADVSGKGISSAFYMAEVKGIFESLSKLLNSPREILIQANQILKKSMDLKSFVSAIYCLIDTESRKLIVSRGGHCPILLLRNNDFHYLRPNGIGLGLDAGENFVRHLVEDEINLMENDILVLFTDGITEAQNEQIEEFGYHRLERIVRESADLSAEEMAKNIIKEISLFSQGTQQHDDITLVIIKCVCKGEKINDRV